MQAEYCSLVYECTVCTLNGQSYILNRCKTAAPVNNGERHTLLLIVNPNDQTLSINGPNTKALTLASPAGRQFDITSSLISRVRPSFLIGVRMFGNYRSSGNIYHIFMYHGALDSIDAQSFSVWR